MQNIANLVVLRDDQDFALSHGQSPFSASTIGAVRHTDPSLSGCKRRQTQIFLGADHLGIGIFFIASHAALCTAGHGVRSHAVPVALVGECSIPLV